MQNEAMEKCIPNQKAGTYTEKYLDEMEISNLSDKEFKLMAIEMLTDLRRKLNIEIKRYRKSSTKYML